MKNGKRLRGEIESGCGEHSGLGRTCGYDGPLCGFCRMRLQVLDWIEHADTLALGDFPNTDELRRIIE